MLAKQGYQRLLFESGHQRISPGEDRRVGNIGQTHGVARVRFVGSSDRHGFAIRKG